MGYNRIAPATIMYFVLFLFVIFISDFVFKVLLSGQNRKAVGRLQTQNLEKNITIFNLIFIFLLVLYLLGAVSTAARYGILNMKGKSSGLEGHASLAAIAISPMILYEFVKTKKKNYLIEVILLYVTMIVFGGKNYIFLAAVASLILIFTDKKVNIGSIIKVGLVLVAIAILIFIMVYGVVPYLISGTTGYGTSDLYGIVLWPIIHMLYYFVAPFLCANTYFKLPVYEGMKKGLTIMFNPCVELYEQFLGNRDFPNIIMTYWAPISSGSKGLQKASNVGGLFSESVFHIGFLNSILFVFVVAFFANFIIYLNKRYGVFPLSAALQTAIIVLCFFNNFYSLLTVFEMVVYAFVIEIISMLIKKDVVFVFRRAA